MNSFIKRTITGVIFVILIIGSVILSHWAFAALFSLVVVGGLAEFLKISRSLGAAVNRKLLILIALIVYWALTLVFFNVIAYSNLIYSLLIVPVFMASELFRKSATPFLNIVYGIVALFWIVLPIALLNGFFSFAEGLAWQKSGALLGFFLILWIYDSGAYIVGSAVGKHKIIERVSPGKSWEGLAGGAAAGFLTAFMVSASFKEFSLIQWLIIAAIIIIFGTLGDLEESLLKRSANLKDSGSILPGHGGILDRFDAVFLAAPVVFIAIVLFRGI